MNNRINIEEILIYHLGIDREDMGAIQGLPILKAAIKEIVKVVIDKCAEEAHILIADLNRNGEIIEDSKHVDTEYRGSEGYDEDPIIVIPYKESILQVKQLIDY